jgi:hypothetical protein
MFPIEGPFAGELRCHRLIELALGRHFPVVSRQTRVTRQTAILDRRATRFNQKRPDIVEGKGTFSGVKEIGEVFGTYVQAGASGSAIQGGQARAMTKGEISLALSGSGRGWDVGVSIGGFTITKKEWWRRRESRAGELCSDSH